MRQTRLWSIAAVITASWLGACGRGARSESGASHLAPPAPRALAFAPGVRMPAPDSPPPEPTASYASLRSACDSVAGWLQPALDTAVTRTDGAFDPEFFLEAPRTGCVFTAKGDQPDLKVSPEDFITDIFGKRGWVPDWHFSADGPDGSDWSVRSRDVLCIAYWKWDGGDDSDTTYVPGTWYELRLECTRWNPVDTLPS